jgi:glucosamine kinase
LKDVQHYLGVDGGQSGTRAALVDRYGRVVVQTESGPLTHIVAPEGARMLQDALTAIRQGLAIGAEPAAVFLGVCAVTSGTRSQRIGEEIARSVWPSSKIRIEGDGLGAWAGGTGGAPGVTVAAGTGSIVEAVNERDEIAEAGGWGHLLGDPGSGWHIGSTAIRRLLRRWDRERSLSPLGHAILEALGVADPIEVLFLVYSDTQDPIPVSRLSRVVGRFAAAGDSEALEIQATCAVALADDVVSAICRLQWEREPVIVATLGQAFKSGPRYREAFERALREGSPVRVRIAAPVLSVLGGNAVMALRLGGVPVDDAVIARLVAEGLGPDPVEDDASDESPA